MAVIAGEGVGREGVRRDRVVVLSTGGTIASRRDPAGGGAVAADSGDDLVATLAGRGMTLPSDIEVAVEQFCNIGSFAFDLDLAFRLARRAGALLADADVRGVVVTQGTDTMEESAWLADLVVGADKPLVYTGAQRLADDADRDGPRNLADSIRVAACDAARGLGATIVFEGEIHAARDATKQHASRVGTFWSGEHGKLGEIDGDRVIVQRRPLLRRGFQAERVETRIDMIRLVMGADARFIDCALESGARGIVIEAFGRGNANAAVVAGIARATEADVPVLVTSRCPQGRVMAIYGNGGGRDAADAGAIFAGDLSGPKARVLLAVLMGLARPVDIREIVAEIGG